MKGAHGLRPAGHEHARCRYCNNEAAHVSPADNTAVGRVHPGDVMYAPHAIGGGIVQCTKSVRQIVDPDDRHRPAPEDTP